MKNSPTRLVSLDNIRFFLVCNVVIGHVIDMFSYPFTFWWAVIDKEGSSRFYETVLMFGNTFVIPCLFFIAAMVIFPSWERSTDFFPEKRTPRLGNNPGVFKGPVTSVLNYMKDKFLRLYVPIIVFLFCAGDVSFNLLSKRLNNVSPPYSETFLNFWRTFVNMPGIYYTGSEKTINAIMFNFQYTWFLTLLFFVTLVTILLSLLFKGGKSEPKKVSKRKKSEPKKVDSRNKIILSTIIFAVVLDIVYVAAMIFYVKYGITIGALLIIGKVMQFMNNQIWLILPIFLFGLYVCKKEWLTRGDVGSWKMWFIIAFVFLVLYVLMLNISFLPAVNEMFKIVEHNFLFVNKMTMPVVDSSLTLAIMCIWFLEPLMCVFILMFFLSFTKTFLNKPNAITAFCSRHSINVYLLHYTPLLVLQYAFLNVSITPIIKVILMIIIVIPACLWLSHRLVYPHPIIAISFFVALKLIALAVGFTFYYWALLALILISFAGAIYETVRMLASARTDAPPVS